MKSYWDKHPSWDEQTVALEKAHPIRQQVAIPTLPGIRPKDKKHLRWKALRYLAKYDEKIFHPLFFLQSV